jgi:1-acyl-sn-glycerol-3-phosphate acyltransferase
MTDAFRPTDEQLALLTRFERLSFEAADILSKRALSPLGEAYLNVAMGGLIGSCASRRFNIVGLEKIRRYENRKRFQRRDKTASFLFVANHRSFFDFFSLAYIVFKKTKLSRRIFFPTRSTFFYDHPLGPAVNLSMSAMRMFPPIMRDAQKRAFNTWAIERCIEELRHPGTIVGIHPEGTRNKGDDPYHFLPAQPGAGKVALEAETAITIPVFLLGMGQTIQGELRKNALAPRDNRIDVYFGDPIDFSDLRAKKHKTTTAKKAANRCVEAIAALAEQQRKASAELDAKGWVLSHG